MCVCIARGRQRRLRQQERRVTWQQCAPFVRWKPSFLSSSLSSAAGRRTSSSSFTTLPTPCLCPFTCIDNGDLRPSACRGAARHSVALVVHLYTSMLAHLHASLNFAIYGLMNPPLTPDEWWWPSNDLQGPPIETFLPLLRSGWHELGELTAPTQKAPKNPKWQLRWNGHTQSPNRVIHGSEPAIDWIGLGGMTVIEIFN